MKYYSMTDCKLTPSKTSQDLIKVIGAKLPHADPLPRPIRAVVACPCPIPCLALILLLCQPLEVSCPSQLQDKHQKKANRSTRYLPVGQQEDASRQMHFKKAGSSCRVVLLMQVGLLMGKSEVHAISKAI